MNVNVIGVPLILAIGPSAAWSGIPTGVSQQWQDVIQDSIILNDAHTFGGVPYSTVSTAGTLVQNLRLEPDAWDDIAPPPQNPWRDINT